METKGRLIAGSHIRNEFILINANEIGRVTSVKELSGQVCRICGDEIEVTVDGEPFAACNECAFPVCRACYEYERREGNQACPQCKTRYKRIKGSPQVEGDEEDDEFEDFDNELEGGSKDPRHFSESALFSQLSTDSFLTYDQEDTGISSDKHALVVPPVPLIDSSTSSPARPMDPKKDLAVYGYGTVTWKDRMEEWKRRQNEKLQIVKHKGDGRNDFFG